MNKEELKQYIDDNIYENQDGEITGEALNAVLKAIVDDGGTEVEANPTGEATTTLNKIKIGETIYKTNNPFAGAVEATDAERLQALANVSNQEAGYDSSEPPVFTGKMGYVVLQPEKSGDVTTSFAAQIANKPNTIFEIRDVYDLNNTSVTIPENCTLKFNGGLIKDGTIVGQNTSIESGTEQIFDENTVLSGTWMTDCIYITNFGAKSMPLIYQSANDSDGYFDTSYDSTQAIQAAFNTRLPVIVPVGNYYVSDTVVIPRNSNIKGSESAGASVDNNYYGNSNRGGIKVARFFTDKYITMFDIQGTVNINNIFVDTDDVPIDAQNDTSVLVFNFNAVYPNMNSLIDSTIYGNRNAPYNLIAYKFDADKDISHAKGYLSGLQLKGTVVNAKIGVHIARGVNKDKGCFRWVDSIYLGININRARYYHLIESGLHYVIEGIFQNGNCFPTVDDPERYHGMTHISGATDVVISNNAYYWDVPGIDTPTEQGFYSHKTSINVENISIPSNYEFCYSPTYIYNTDLFKRLCQYGNNVIISPKAGVQQPVYYQPTILDGIIAAPYLRTSIPWLNATVLNYKENNKLFNYSRNVGAYTPLIRYFDYSNEEYTEITDESLIPVELSANAMNGEFNIQNIKHQTEEGHESEYMTINDGSYIEYSNFNYITSGVLMLQQYSPCKVHISKVELYLGDTLKSYVDCLTNNVVSQSFVYFASEGSNFKIRLYLKNNTSGTIYNLQYSIALLDGNSNEYSIRGTGNSVKKGALTLYHTQNPLSFVNTTVNKSGTAYPYSVMYKGTTANRSSIVPSPIAGDLYFDTTLNRVTTYKNSTDGWTNLDGSPLDYDMSQIEDCEKQIEDCEKKVDIINVAFVPSGGMLPNKQYNYGELDSDITFSIKISDIDDTVVNTWNWQFGTPNKDITITITLPSGTVWENGVVPVFEHSKLYTITIKNGIASYKVAPFNASNYLRFTAKEANASVGVIKTGTPSFDADLWYRTNSNSNWVEFIIGQTEPIVLSNINDWVEFKGDNSSIFNKDINDYISFDINNGEIEASGDITSILNNIGGDVTLSSAVTLSSVFKGCTKLTKAPNLPSTTTTGSNAYCRAFQNCSSLEESPVINLKEAKTQAFYQAFKGCSSLNKVTIYTEKIKVGASASFNEWLAGTASNGVIICPPMLELPNNAIPTNWTRENIEYEGKVNVVTSGSNVTNSNSSSYVDLNSAYIAELTPDEGYVIDSVGITMGGIDVTSFVYNQTNHVIYIAGVTGNIVINVTTTQQNP